MLIGTFCRFSTRFCEVTVIVSSVALSVGVAGVAAVPVVSVLASLLVPVVAGGSCGADCAQAIEPNAR
jgi:hypothetical protein